MGKHKVSPNKCVPQRLCTYWRSGNADVIERWAAVAVNESTHPLHSFSLFCHVSPMYVKAIGKRQVEHNRSKPTYNTTRK
jgi:hypothetical protein